MFVVQVTANGSQRIGGCLVHRPVPATFNLSQLGSHLLLGGAVLVSILAHTFWIIAVAAVLWLGGIIAWSYVIGVASQVYRCALFLYASEGLISEPYNRELLDMAWKIKKI